MCSIAQHSVVNIQGQESRVAGSEGGTQSYALCKQLWDSILGHSQSLWACVGFNQYSTIPLVHAQILKIWTVFAKLKARSIKLHSCKAASVYGFNGQTLLPPITLIQLAN